MLESSGSGGRFVSEWQPDWPAPARVRTAQTTRLGGVSAAPYHTLNLGLHVGDDAPAVAVNRRRVMDMFDLPSEPRWMNQVHGTRVVRLENETAVPEADASVTFAAGPVCTIMTADCLPVLFCDRAGTVVAAAHAGWRGLAAGVLEATVHAMQRPPFEILAWMGPAIGPQAFEVGEDVRAAFVRSQPEQRDHFQPVSPGKYHADIFALATTRLQAAGVRQIYGGGVCTVTQERYFFSHRRDRVSGRMASLIWRAD